MVIRKPPALLPSDFLYSNNDGNSSENKSCNKNDSDDESRFRVLNADAHRVLSVSAQLYEVEKLRSNPVFSHLIDRSENTSQSDPPKLEGFYNTPFQRRLQQQIL